MSITSRINEMSTHIEQAYDELQGLGADLTNVNKNIENISMVLDDIYDSMPQVSGEGTSLTLDDTRVGKIKSTLKGNTSQTTYSGKNLIDSQFTTRTLNGVTITNNGDGTYTLNGTSSASSAFSLQSITGQESSHPLITNIKNNVGKYLTMSTGYSSNQGCYLQLNLSNQGGGSGQYGFVTSVYTYSNTLITSNESDIAYINFFIGIMSGASFNNLKIYPMITIQSSQITPAPTPSDFEPYVGGTASPNPSYPQPINVVSGDNEIRVCGKNLWGSEEHGSINEQTGVDAYNENRWRTKGYIDVTPNTQYTLSSDANSNIYYIFYYYDNTKAFISSQPIIGKESATGTTPNNCYYMRCVIADTASIKTTERQLEKGSSASTYEPYQGNTYNIDLGVKNLIDFNRTAGVFSGNGTTFEETKYFPNMTRDSGTGSSCELVSYADNVLTIKGRYGQGVGFPIKCKPNQSYFVKVTSSDSNARLWLSFYDNTGTFISGSSNDSNLERSVTSPPNSYWVIPIFGVYGSSLTNVEFSDIKVLEGNKEQTISPTPIELCKIGNYQDYFYKDSGKWYLHKEIGKLIIDENTNLTTASSDSFRIPENITINIVRPVNQSTNVAVFSNYLIPITWAEAWAGKTGFISMGTTNDMRFRITENMTLEEAKTWLSTHNIELYYELVTPTNTEITYQPLIDQLNELEKAMSKDGQTNISQVNNDLPFIISASALKEWQESTSLNSTLSMVNPLSLGNTLNTQENDIQPIEVDNIEPLEEEENEES